MSNVSATATLPIESPPGDPLTRLIDALEQNGFQPLHEDEAWQAFGEKVFLRSEKVLIVNGETIFLFIEHDSLTDKILRQAMESLSQLFRARHRSDRALSVFQSRTVYVCFISRNEIPLDVNVSRYTSSAGGAVLVPVIIVPDINQVIYPLTEERIGGIKPRIEYLQYLIGERFESTNIHRQTVQAIYFAGGIALIIVVGIILSFVL
jgi:hypothetical protein